MTSISEKFSLLHFFFCSPFGALVNLILEIVRPFVILESPFLVEGFLLSLVLISSRMKAIVRQ